MIRAISSFWLSLCLFCKILVWQLLCYFYVSRTAKNHDELVSIIDCVLENVWKWTPQNKLQIHPKKTKHMYIGLFLNIKLKIAQNPLILTNTLPAQSRGKKTIHARMLTKIKGLLVWEQNIL